jgi:dTDP-4-dehydrorhamnose 3,5-epimerase
MIKLQTEIPDVFVIEAPVFGDDRGFFQETWSSSKFELLGLPWNFVQDNHSRSPKGILRGLHYQIKHPQGKLVRVTHGSVLDVAVDLRKSSLTFGKHVAVELTGENKRMLWIPPGFAHGFYVLSGPADFLYKCTDYYAPQFERSLLWNDPLLEIDWKTAGHGDPSLSSKDKAGLPFALCEYFE